MNVSAMISSAMISTVIAISIVLAAQLPAAAQSPTTILIDIERGRLEWEWTQGSGGPAESFRIECTDDQGRTVTTDIADPTARMIPLARAIDRVGTWTCVARAANAFGLSDPSPSVTFQAGRRPAPPATMRIVVE